MASIAVQLPSAPSLLEFGFPVLLFLCSPFQVSPLIRGGRLSAASADLNEMNLQRGRGSPETSVEFPKALDEGRDQFWRWRGRH